MRVRVRVREGVEVRVEPLEHLCGSASQLALIE